MTFDLICGILLVCFSIATIVVRVKKLEHKYFWKTDAMKKMYGDTKGKVIHIVFYTVLPLVAGILFIVREL